MLRMAVSGLGAGSSPGCVRRIYCLLYRFLCLFPFLGRDFFPSVDAGQFSLHVRVPAGTRLEETALPLLSGRGSDPRNNSIRGAKNRPRQHWSATIP